jgi:hypothetical protein
MSEPPREAVAQITKLVSRLRELLRSEVIEAIAVAR